MKSSKKTIMAQRTAFLMLLIQGTSTLGLGILVVFFATLIVFTSIPIFSTLTNISLLLCGVPYGCIYPFVVLITTRPYLGYIKGLLFKSVQIIQVATIGTSTM
ncbi:unnamed protein product, partial [Mesorhabditis belari]|uniref:Uncharacterized protein n=1 Tax=Mesorhabditis belari TaxID=2138241 RepID=A0AAF3EEK7_9BILA